MPVLNPIKIYGTPKTKTLKREIPSLPLLPKQAPPFVKRCHLTSEKQYKKEKDLISIMTRQYVEQENITEPFDQLRLHENWQT